MPKMIMNKRPIGRKKKVRPRKRWVGSTQEKQQRKAYEVFKNNYFICKKPIWNKCLKLDGDFVEKQLCFIYL